MIRQLRDPANAITATGLALSVIGIHCVLTGSAELGVAIVLWALLADHLDGVVALRTKNRAPETGKIGKNLDSLADLVSAGVFPAVLILQVAAGAAGAVFVAVTLVTASALRLSYFNVFGLADGRFIGVPTTYVVPVTAVVFLARPLLPTEDFPLVLGLALLAVAVLHVTPVRVPRTEGAMYAVVALFAVGSSVILAWRTVY